jgi:hypothetical protein
VKIQAIRYFGLFAPRGQNEIAQGATLGEIRENRCALKGRDEAKTSPKSSFIEKVKKRWHES